MMPLRLPLAALALLCLAACSQAPAEGEDAPVAAPETAVDPGPPPVYTHDGWIGRWTGVEGMYVEIQPTGDGTYQLEMQSDLDTNGTYIGTSIAEGISFERDGKTLVLRADDGAATGLKWLDGKTDCLMVAEGEGYCRG